MRYIASCSCGKDSLAMVYKIIEEQLPLDEIVFYDTGMEFQSIYNNWKKLTKLVWECPNCHNRNQSKMNVVRRTCGYLGSNFWNGGRTQEIKERVLHL